MNKYSLLFFAFLITLLANATHIRSGEIQYKRIAPFTSVVGSVTLQVYTYSITVIKYFDHGPAIGDRCQDTVSFGDGQIGIAPRINGAITSTCNCGANPCGEIIVNSSGYVVKKCIYSITHTYAATGVYTIKSTDLSRTGGIHNIPNSNNIAFYLEARIYVSNNIDQNSSPVLSNPPIDKAFLGSCLYLNCCAFDVDGDSLSYELSTCKDGNGQTISGYFLPETGSGGNISINPITGVLTWCTPQFVDDYNLVILVKEWRKNSCAGNFELIGYVTRDFQLIVSSLSASAFSTSTFSDVCVIAGASVSHTFNINSNNVFPKVLGITTTFSGTPAVINPTFVGTSAVASYSWQTLCSQAKKQPYDVYLQFKIPGFTGDENYYRQFKVQVIPRSPVILSTGVDTGKVTLNWSHCSTTNAGYNIYRKTGINTWVPGSCEQGVSASSGFILVGTAPGSATSFTDTNVWPILNGTLAHYVVTAFTSDCAESRADNAQTVTLLVGINENTHVDQFGVFPNPFHDKIEITFDLFKSEPSVVNLYAVDGKLIPFEISSRSPRKWEISTQNVSSGIYFLQIKSNSGIITKRLVKE